MINICFDTKIQEPSSRVISISDAFGVGIDETHKHTVVENFEIPNFDIMYITGMSGSGKSSLLKELKKEYSFKEIEFDRNSDKPIVDLLGDSLEKALELLNIVGLGEAFLFVKPYKILSDGQKYRFEIAKLIESGQDVWCIDEFCSFLDRVTAKVVSFNLQKVARRLNKKVIVATAHTDLSDYLKPSHTVQFGIGEGAVVKENNYDGKNPFIDLVKIEEGTIEDYKLLGKYHYKNTNVTFVKKVYKMVLENVVVGVAVYTTPKQQLVGRNLYFQGKYLNKGVPIMSEINKDFVTGARYVIHPMFRGVGFGTHLVKETVKLLPYPYVEVISTMSKYNRFLEKAGLAYISDNTTQDRVKQQQKIKDLLKQYGFDYEFLTSLQYCQKILDTIPHSEIRNAFYSALRSKLFTGGSSGKKVRTKADFEEVELTAKLISSAKCTITEYYLWINESFTNIN